MYVNIEAVGLHNELAEKFGVPTPRHPFHKEVFGPYRAGGKTLFWWYDPSTACWDVQLAGRKLADPSWSVWLPAKMEEGLATLQYLPQPNLPERLDRRQEQLPFYHEGYAFQWDYVPRLQGWELTPHSVNGTTFRR